VTSRRNSQPDWRPVAPAGLPDRLAEWLARSSGTVRVAIDGAPCTAPADLAESLVEPLRALGRPVAHLIASSFWRDASLRLEHGREDVESYRSWLDADALRREVLDAAVSTGSYLPSLRDPVTNRSTRAVAVPVAAGLVLIVSGSLLLGRGLPFDRTIHLAMSAPARARHTPDAEAWTLPAYDSYDTDVRPCDVADLVIKLDDPRHPAIRGT
jgi:hypothetical protein